MVRPPQVADDDPGGPKDDECVVDDPCGYREREVVVEYQAGYGEDYHDRPCGEEYLREAHVLLQPLDEPLYHQRDGTGQEPQAAEEERPRPRRGLCEIERERRREQRKDPRHCAGDHQRQDCDAPHGVPGRSFALRLEERDIPRRRVLQPERGYRRSYPYGDRDGAEHAVLDCGQEPEEHGDEEEPENARPEALDGHRGDPADYVAAAGVHRRGGGGCSPAGTAAAAAAPSLLPHALLPVVSTTRRFTGAP